MFSDESKSNSEFSQTSHVGRYQLIRILARGGMAEVYLARSIGAHGFEKLVAIKQILPIFSSEQAFINMLVDEARISVMLSHPNIAQILEFGEHKGQYFLVMEYVPGQSFFHLLQRLSEENERIDPLDASFIVVQMLQGLHAAHTQRNRDGSPAQIIHRDISPQNVMISYDGVIKLIDFGIARATERLERTQVGTIKGKMRYLAPEMLDSKRFGTAEEFDHRIDIFAAGILLFEAISGRKLFQGEGELEVYKSILKDRVPDLSEQGICTPELMKIIFKALEKHAGQRYQSAEDFADDLRAYVYRTDPAFTGKAIRELMQRFFAREHEECLRLDIAQPKDMGKQEITFVEARKVQMSSTLNNIVFESEDFSKAGGSVGASLDPTPSDKDLSFSSKSLSTGPSDPTALLHAHAFLEDRVPADASMQQPISPRDEQELSPNLISYGLSEQNQTQAGRTSLTQALRNQGDILELDLSGEETNKDVREPGFSTRILARHREILSDTGTAKPGVETRLLKHPSLWERFGAKSADFFGKSGFEEVETFGASLAEQREEFKRKVWIKLSLAGMMLGLFLALVFYPISKFIFTDQDSSQITESSSFQVPNSQVPDSQTVLLSFMVTPKNAQISFDKSEYSVLKTGSKLKVKVGQELKVTVSAEGYDSLHETIKIPTFEENKTQNEQHYKYQLKVKPIKVVIKASPKKAKILVNGADYKKEELYNPLDILRVVVSYKGYRSYKKVFKLQLGEDFRKTIKLHKLKKDAENGLHRKKKKQKFGKFVLTSVPWAQVTIDGKKYSDVTPLSIELSVGKHHVVMRHPPKNLMKKFSIRVKEGKLGRKHVNF